MQAPRLLYAVPLFLVVGLVLTGGQGVIDENDDHPVEKPRFKTPGIPTSFDIGAAGADLLGSWSKTITRANAEGTMFDQVSRLVEFRWLASPKQFRATDGFTGLGSSAYQSISGTNAAGPRGVRRAGIASTSNRIDITFNQTAQVGYAVVVTSDLRAPTGINLVDVQPSASAQSYHNIEFPGATHRSDRVATSQAP